MFSRIDIVSLVLSMYFLQLTDAVRFANQTLMRLMLGSNDTNVSASEIRRIHNDLKKRNFTMTLLKLDMEKELAQNASVLANDLLNKTMILSNLVTKQDSSIVDIIKTFLAIDKGAQNALYAANNGSGQVNIAKAIDFHVRSFLTPVHSL